MINRIMLDNFFDLRLVLKFKNKYTNDHKVLFLISGKNSCPEGWIPYNDTCYQFNMGPSQKMTWTEAEAACKSISDFASLVKITGQNEQDFITRRIQDFSSNADAWIGLSDLKNEGVFKWSDDGFDLTNTDYQLWANGKPSENKENSDCVMILWVRQDGAWTVQDCSLKQNFICTRNRGKHEILNFFNLDELGLCALSM
jgi:hypothetical protein